MDDNTTTVFNRTAAKRALLVSPEKMVDLLGKSMVQGDNGESPRNYADYLISLSLDEESPLPLYPLNEKNSLQAFQKDFNQIKEENRVDKVIVFDTETTVLYPWLLFFIQSRRIKFWKKYIIW